MLILGTETAYNNEKQNQKLKCKTIANSGEAGESDFQSNHILRIKCPVFKPSKSQDIQVIHKVSIGKCGPFKGKNKQKLSLKKKEN